MRKNILQKHLKKYILQDQNEYFLKNILSYNPTITYRRTIPLFSHLVTHFHSYPLIKKPGCTVDPHPLSENVIFSGPLLVVGEEIFHNTTKEQLHGQKTYLGIC